MSPDKKDEKIYNLNLTSLKMATAVILLAILYVISVRKRSFWMDPKQKKRPWLCRIDQSLYYLVIHCCETRESITKLFGRLVLLGGHIMVESLNDFAVSSCSLYCCISLRSLACLWCKMPMFQKMGMKEGGGSLPLAFQYLILMI